MSWLVNLLAFLVVIGILVTVHEFGHFWVARRCGVGVQRFSIGFGRVLWRRYGRDGVEYAISALPLGGYVKMLDEREEAVPADQLSRAFNRKPLWQRNAVIIAGPAFNFAFAVLVFWALFLMGDTVLRPVLGDIASDTPAAEAGFQPGDEIRAVAGREVAGWSDVMRQVLSQGAGNEALPVTVATATGERVTRELNMAAIGPIGEQDNVMQALGWQPKRPPLPPVIQEVRSGDPAAAAGLRSGDRLVSVAGSAIEDWQGLVDAIEAHRGESMRLIVERGSDAIEIEVTVPEEGPIGVIPQRPEPGVLDAYQRELTYGVVGAFVRGAEETWNRATFMVTITGKMITGDASTRAISGPVGIAEYAGTSASLGLVPFLTLLATISISLGIINLFPIPILDGGQLLFNACEWVMGRPLSESAQAMGTQVGLALIVMLMTLAFYNDLLRVLGAE
jgi:regulator of sigma E protease